MMQDLCNIAPGFRPSKSAPCSPVKPLGVIRTRSESFHVTHKVPLGDTPYVKAKNLVDKDPERAIPLFWAAINAGDRVDSALKDMAIVMKQQNRAEEAIEAIKSLRSRCSDQAQESLDNILLDLYKRCGRLDDQIALLKHKLFLIQQGMAFNGKRTKTARSQGKKFQLSIEQEATRLLGNLGWAFMQQNNYIEAEDAYRRALLIAPDNNKMCNLGICLMKQGRISEAKETLRRVRPAMVDGPRGTDSHLKAFERAQQMLRDLESEMMNKGGEDRVKQSRLFDVFLGSSSIWQPQPCKEPTLPSTINMRNLQDDFADENSDLNRINNQVMLPLQRSMMKPITVSSGNSLNIDAQPFYSSKLVKNPSVAQFHDNLGPGLKRTRSVNAADYPLREEFSKPSMVNLLGQPDNKTRRRSPIKEDNEWTDLLPDTNAFEEAIIAAVIGPTKENMKTMDYCTSPMICQSKVDKRLTVVEDITFSLSPRA
ncbi:Tetratricopeptide repeat-containing domain [Macleaya cordata]|uniref:Tetratricopeptide repeat-containing domain n=1 Tax=Macleaya cordata TaxID=56857 RepID=A0A200RA67_MACCD|nr:Tetratricopeptide repeat-containing domain [Macleaya cordata]